VVLCLYLPSKKRDRASSRRNIRFLNAVFFTLANDIWETEDLKKATFGMKCPAADRVVCRLSGCLHKGDDGKVGLEIRVAGDVLSVICCCRLVDFISRKLMVDFVQLL
jgi:hypothetical protein